MFIQLASVNKTWPSASRPHAPMVSSLDVEIVCFGIYVRSMF